MRIYIAGPYGDTNPKEVIAANVRVADEAGRALVKKGHVPFIPHKMTWHWEDDPELTKEDFLRVDLEWLSLCDAILLLPRWETSGGAKRELEFARKHGKKVYYSIGDVPNL